MTGLGRTTFTASELAWIVPPGGLVLLEAGSADDPAHRASRVFAIDVAIAAGAGLLLYDLPAGRRLADAATSGPLAPGAEVPSGPQLLGAAELDDIRYAHLREQLDEARARSVSAFAWLARRSSPSGIVEAVKGAGRPRDHVRAGGETLKHGLAAPPDHQLLRVADSRPGRHGGRNGSGDARRAALRRSSGRDLRRA